MTDFDRYRDEFPVVGPKAYLISASLGPVSLRAQRYLQQYILDASHCLFCGYCAAACPVEAVVMSDIQDIAGYSRRNTGSIEYAKPSACIRS